MDIGLEKLRENIDSLDDQMIHLLQQRMNVVKSIGLLKKEKGQQAFDPKRWEVVLTDRIEKGKKQGLSQRLIQNIWEAIHEESLAIEQSAL